MKYDGYGRIGSASVRTVNGSRQSTMRDRPASHRESEPATPPGVEARRS